MTIADLVAFHQAIASEHIYMLKDGSSFSCKSRMPCSTCPIENICDKYDENYRYDIIAELKTLPEFSLIPEELKAKYPEYFI